MNLNTKPRLVIPAKIALPSTGTRTVAVAQNEGDRIMSLIEKLANSNVDEKLFDRIERLFELRDMEKSKAAREHYMKAMAMAQCELQSVIATRQNEQTKTRYADLSTIHRACKPVWTQYGFSVSTSVYQLEREGWLGIQCTVMHSAGHTEVFKNDWPLDSGGLRGTPNKTAIQAIGSTISYARRYSEMMAFDLSVNREDNDGNVTVAVITQLQAMQIKDLLRDTGSDMARFCKWLGIQDVGSMPITSFDKAYQTLTKLLNQPKRDSQA